MLLIRFFGAVGEVGENHPKVTEVSIQWLNEMKYPLELGNKTALCLTQDLIKKTNMKGPWKQLGSSCEWRAKVCVVTPQK